MATVTTTPAPQVAGQRRRRGRTVATAVVAAAGLLLAACGGESTRVRVGKAADRLFEVETTATIDVSSPVMANGERLPTRFTCDGTGISPAVAWSGVPEGTDKLAIVLDDPAAGVTVVHWALFDIDPALPGVAEDDVPDGAHQARNSETSGYDGPCPPAGKGEHTYRLSVYALDRAMPEALGEGADLLDALEALEERAIAKGTMRLLYSR